MEAKIRGKYKNLYSPLASDLKGAGKKSLEWDLNDWRWDGDLFTASQLNPAPSDCRSKQLFYPVEPEIPANAAISNLSSSSSDDVNLGTEKGKKELEKRRRIVVVEGGKQNDEAGSPNLKLGGQIYPIMEEDAKSGKKTKIVGTASNRTVCQVEDCRADLSNAKDYHRRHKVCDVHSKASKALVGNVLQRFCQQCSRFHLLQEFDEGKRSCRRRLAGHNKRRRKTHPENIANGGSLNDERGSSYLLTSLLRILSNLQSSSSDQTKDQDLLSHLLRNLANVACTTDGSTTSGSVQGSQALFNAGTTSQPVGKASDVVANEPGAVMPFSSASRKQDCINSPNFLRPLDQCGTVPASDLAQQGKFSDDTQDGTLQTLPGSHSTELCPARSAAKENETEGTDQRIKMNNIDLNYAYDDSQGHAENLNRSPAPSNPGTGSLSFPLWMKSNSQKTSPPYMNRNSDSSSTQSPSSSSGEDQSRTGRIVLKLFGKDPNDVPIALRKQILDWLSHSPTDIESYMRPGCIILTIYLRLRELLWEEICHDLGANLSNLLDSSNDSFWRTGWIYARVQHCVSFIFDGKVVLDAPLPLKSHVDCRILSIKPIAVSLSGSTQFIVKGFNLFQPTARLLCALEGKHLVQESCYNLQNGADKVDEHSKLQCFIFSCPIPNFIGRGFIEVEDHGLSGSFFPFIVAEQDVCSEICVLEDVIEMAENNMNKNAEKMETRNQALEFVHEMGWLLHRGHSKVRLGDNNPSLGLFSFKRFKWLIEFSMEHDWCAVVKKLLAILFDGIVDSGAHSSIELALLDLSLLHRAVRRNCRPMVELLLRYTPEKQSYIAGSGQNQEVCGGYNKFIFKPDIVGPAGITPLHMAASRDGCENVLDALTNDPGSVGIEAWKRARDSTGLTPNDYACLQGHYSYINLVQRKISKRAAESAHVVLDIPSNSSDIQSKLKDGLKSAKVAMLQIEKGETKPIQLQCKVCEHKMACSVAGKSLVYRPAMLSMVAIAAVCVCVALLFKSSPEVLHVFRPFRWELLKYGSS
uniref:SBP-type domain-containing protein n=3 Tax=Rhizophora mucronata TaxID=61149 RepID=A0A2P2KP32_RHIMU